MIDTFSTWFLLIVAVCFVVRIWWERREDTKRTERACRRMYRGDGLE